MTTLNYKPDSTNFAGARIDEREGIICGMSVITTGEARGHGLFVDAKSLQTTLAATKSHASGVLCKMDHGSGTLEAIGALRDFRIDGES